LAGPTCDSVDVMYYDSELSETTTINDLIVFYNTGAYTTEYGTNFNGIPSPKIIFENNLFERNSLDYTFERIFKK
jgi:ornithine decarboxylase